MPKTLDIITSSLKRIGVLDAYTPPSAEDAADSLALLQELIDLFDAKREFVYAVNFQVFTLTGKTPPNQATPVAYSIGPSGSTNPNPDFVTTLGRPVRIQSANYVLAGQSASGVDLNLAIRDKNWWSSVTLKGQTSSLATNLYYEPTFPAGACYFWPVPTNLDQVRLELWQNIAQPLGFQDIIQLPPAYQSALTWKFCVQLCPLFQRAVPPDIREEAREAMGVIMSNNLEAPKIVTNQGMSSGQRRGGRPDFNFLDGLTR